MKTITSRSNTYIKFVRSLRTKKGRNQSSKFYLEGIRLIGEALEMGFPLDCILYSPELLVSEYGKKLIYKAQATGLEIIEISKDVFQSFSLKEGPHGIASVGSQVWSELPDERVMDGLWIALDRVQDPGNLGTIMRSLDAAGGEGVILIGDTTDPYHPSAVRSSTGALFSLPIIKVDADDFISWKTNNKKHCVGTICENGISYRNLEYPVNMTLMMGSEQKGLSQQLASICDALITIHMTGRVDSLNLSNAASIVLFEIYTQRRNYD